MIDTHCHLNYIKYKDSTEKLISDAVDAGVGTIINVGTDIESSLISVELADKYNFVYATVGVHPHDTNNVNDSVLLKLKDMAKNKKVVAVGEIGLDYYRDHSPREIQRKIFARQLELAVDLKLPVVIHSRDAHDDSMEIIKEYAFDLPGGVFHCFQGNYEAAMKVIELGFIISVGGVITYKNSEMAETAKQVPLDKIILETDAPFLTPVPYRGKTNRPELVTFVYKKLAELKNISIKEVEKTIDSTANKLFGLVEIFGD